MNLVFLLAGFPAVVLFLGGDVLRYFCQAELGDRKGSVSSAPAKFAPDQPIFIDPVGGAAL